MHVRTDKNVCMYVCVPSSLLRGCCNSMASLKTRKPFLSTSPLLVGNTPKACSICLQACLWECDEQQQQQQQQQQRFMSEGQRNDNYSSFMYQLEYSLSWTMPSLELNSFIAENNYNSSKNKIPVCVWIHSNLWNLGSTKVRPCHYQQRRNTLMLYQVLWSLVRF